MLVEPEGIIEQWQRIADAQGMIEVGWADWFHIRDYVFDKAAFWEILAKCARQKRFNHGVWLIIESLYETVIPQPANVRPFQKSKADRLRCNKRHFLTTQYHIARINRDSKLAQRLCSRYPNWPEIRELAQELAN